MTSEGAGRVFAGNQEAVDFRRSRSSPGRLIAALHAEDPRDWPQIVALYDELARLTGSPIVELNRAVALAETEGPGLALAIVDGLPLEGYRYLHSTRAELLHRLGRTDEARSAYARGLALVEDDAERRLWERRLAEIEATPDVSGP